MSHILSSNIESDISSALATLSIAFAAAMLLPSCQYAPQHNYAQLPAVVEQREELSDQLLALLPEEQRQSTAAIEEANWLSDTAYKASVSIARINDPALWPAWMNNRLVNAPFNIRERGLCWHYQHDLYRELRRRKLRFFTLGCCVRDRNKGSEHNCVYVCAAGSVWPQAIVLDAWKKNGRLVTFAATEIDLEAWQERAETTHFLNWVYAEGHNFPIEHWAMVKSGKKWNDYIPSWFDEGRNSRQGKIMYSNMYRGLREREGKPTDYN